MRALHWKMALRRRKSNVLTALLIALSAAFLMVYPGFIVAAEAELGAAYDQIEVAGWLVNAAGYDDPVIPLETYEAILETGFVKTHCALSYASFTPVSGALEAMRMYDPELINTSDAELTGYLERNLMYVYLPGPCVLCGVNRTDAEATLARIQGSVEWLEGYSAADLAGREAVCIYPALAGVALGEEVSLILRQAKSDSPEDGDSLREIVAFKVVGLHALNRGADIVAYCPLGVLQRLLSADGRWKFALRSFSFTLQNTRELPRFKDSLTALELDRDESVRAAIDDRILQGTVAPIEKNIALLRGVQTLLFALVTGMGFLLCFLLARARKPEFAVMRMLGQGPLSLMLGALAEQVALCALGLGVGVLLALLISEIASITDWRIPALIAACYLAGAATAALLGAHGRPMLLLKGRE